MDETLNATRWMKAVLIAVAIHYVLWGSMSILFPVEMLGWLGFVPPPLYPQLWQGLGLLLVLIGLGFVVAARDPFRHWPIVLIGLLGKILGPIGIWFGPSTGAGLPSAMSWNVIINDLVWWIPLTTILWRAMRYHAAEQTIHNSDDFDDPIRELYATSGKNLEELSVEKPQLLVFLRHAGCTFCRESLSILSKQRAEIEAAGCGIVMVHLGQDDEQDQMFFEKYRLADLPRISDPACRLYRQCGIDLGNFRQLYGLKVWVRGFIAGYLNGHGIGRAQGNTYQMPGAFVFHNGEFVRGFRPRSAAEKPDYLNLVKTALAIEAEQVA